LSTTRRNDWRIVISTGLQLPDGAEPPEKSGSSQQAGNLSRPQPSELRSMSCGVAKALLVTSN
jgi:hypothetical protein